MDAARSSARRAGGVVAALAAIACGSAPLTPGGGAEPPPHESAGETTIGFAALPVVSAQARLAFTADGRSIVARTTQYVAVVDVESGRVRAILPHSDPRSGEDLVIGGGRLVLVTSPEPFGRTETPRPRLWDLARDAVTEIGPPTEAAWLAADGSFVLAHHRGVLSAWSTASGRRMWERALEERPVAVAIAASRSIVLERFSGGDRIVSRLDPTDGQERARAVVSGLSSRRMRVDPRGRWVATAEGDRVTLRRTGDLGPGVTLEPPRGGLYEHGWSASGRSVWVLGREALELFDASGRRKEQVAVDALRLYPWHDALVGEAGTVLRDADSRVWRIEGAARRPIGSWAGRALVLSPDESSVARFEDGRRVCVADARDGSDLACADMSGELVSATDASAGADRVTLETHHGVKLVFDRTGASSVPVPESACDGPCLEVLPCAAGRGLCVRDTRDLAVAGVLEGTEHEEAYEDDYGDSHAIAQGPGGARALVVAGRRWRVFDVASRRVVAERALSYAASAVALLTNDLAVAWLEDRTARVVRLSDWATVETLEEAAYPIYVGERWAAMATGERSSVVDLASGTVAFEVEGEALLFSDDDAQVLVREPSGALASVRVSDGAVLARREVGAASVDFLGTRGGDFALAHCRDGRIREVSWSSDAIGDAGPCPPGATVLDTGERFSVVARTGESWIVRRRDGARLRVRARMTCAPGEERAPPCTAAALVEDDRGRFWIAPELLPLLVQRGSGPVLERALAPLTADHPRYAPSLVAEFFAEPGEGEGG